MPELVAEVSFELQSTKYPSSIPVSCELIFSENDFHQTEKLNKNGDIWSSSTLFYLGGTNLIYKKQAKLQYTIVKII